MSAPAHTPGPWRAAGDHVFSVRGRLTVTRTVYGTEGERLANARLIAAAPELVEALRGMLDKHIAHHNAIEHAAARALLARIDGEQA